MELSIGRQVLHQKNRGARIVSRPFSRGQAGGRGCLVYPCSTFVRETLSDVWRRLGPLGLVRGAWRRSFGRLLDVRVVIEWALDAPAARFVPRAGFRYVRPVADERSPTVVAAAQLLGVRLADRLPQDVFVALDADGDVAACTWNDPPEGGSARQRGVAVAPKHRGLSLGGTLLLFQAQELAQRGVSVILYRTDIGNRASRRMFHRIGATWKGASLLLVVLGRGVAVKTLKSRGEAFVRRGWERERRKVLGG